MFWRAPCDKNSSHGSWFKEKILWPQKWRSVGWSWGVPSNPLPFMAHLISLMRSVKNHDLRVSKASEINQMTWVIGGKVYLHFDWSRRNVYDASWRFDHRMTWPRLQTMPAISFPLKVCWISSLVVITRRVITLVNRQIMLRNKNIFALPLRFLSYWQQIFRDEDLCSFRAGNSCNAR